MLKVNISARFPNGYAVRETLALLQKIFPVRQCENSVYRNRSRPCLQYQIGRCLGPCVAGLVSEEEYAQQVEYVRLFLAGKDDQVLTQLIARMEKASAERWSLKRPRESATKFRRCAVSLKNSLFPILATISMLSAWPLTPAWPACMCLFIRQGKVLGSRSYLPKVPGERSWVRWLKPSSAQFYLQGSQMRTLPSVRSCLISISMIKRCWRIRCLELAGRRKINVQTKPRGDRARYLKLARTNAATALNHQTVPAVDCHTSV